MNKIFVFLKLTSILLLAACATDQAAQLREEKPMSVGLVGLQYRPQPNLGVGVGASIGSAVPRYCETWVCTTSEIDKGAEFSSGKYVKGSAKHTDVGFYVNYFPWDTSAFFLGGGIAQRSLSATMTISSTNESTSFKSSSMYLRPAIGWNWIWTPGFSLFLDFGVGLPLSHSRTVSADASDSAKDAAKYLDEKVLTNLRVPVGGGSSLIGWSFAF